MVWYTSSKEAASPPLATQDSQLFAQSPQMGFISQKNLVCNVWNVYYNILARLFPCEGSFRLDVRSLWSAASSWLFFYPTLTAAKICMNQLVSPKSGWAGAAWNTLEPGGHAAWSEDTYLQNLGGPSSPPCPVEFGTNGKCGEAWAGWRALCYPSSPCLPLSLQSTSHSESNTEPQRRDAARFRITPSPHLPARALWSRFLDPPASSRLWVRGKRRENLQSLASTGLLATSSRSAFLRHCDFNCGCINTKWLHCSRRWWERELCILTALRQNFSGTATHKAPTNPTQPSLFSCTITFSTRIRNGRRLLGKMVVPSRPPSIFRPPWSWWQKAIRGRIWAQVVLPKSTMWRVWGGPESPTATSMIEDRWIIKSHSWSQHFTGNWLSQVSHLRYVWTNRSAFGISEECRKVQRRHFCRLFFGGGALPSAKWKELSLLGFSDAPPHLCSCGKSEL